jgi:hypothetical protein
MCYTAEYVLHRRACDKRIIEINRQLGKASKADDTAKIHLLSNQPF